MTFLQATILSVVQGVTEFLPVSSSAHLVILQHFMEVQDDTAHLAFFDCVLHLGTTGATIWYFRERLQRTFQTVLTAPQQASPERRLALLIALSTVTTIAVLLPFRKHIEGTLEHTLPIAFNLMVTAGVLVLASGWQARHPEGRRLEQVTWGQAAALGVAQSCSAVFRGLSRSGTSISAALLLGLGAEAAVEYSFLMSIPIILLVTAKEFLDAELHQAGLVLWGFLVSFAVGLWALRFLAALVRRGQLRYFAYYCFPLGVAVLIWSLAR